MKEKNKQTKKKYSAASLATRLRKELNRPEAVGTWERSSNCLCQLNKNQNAMPKINWNKNGKINQCMGNTLKK